ncbi:MAG: MBL fold metallo-hydrolase [Candidatus Caldarchaeum sp.]|nr:MBL fold metallo-hydrolase [Candidatus Caldarchaeum sp.]MCS7133222.1 MBL fold metallo-hydrolase [Candidatus Caldarchaeum sp.]MCX8201549.1 MBL fold metallo-hydrolase [Candidatus Caldarchaeum sp.]MDW8062863.1 MBL fold metallo-hydrolase [Candidatus Caldarchaeum sp.]MDW8435896.1 MBL fold metallo-hydrolase [Candidatus Caldarchaeum sp.]
MVYRFRDVEISWLGHDSYRIKKDITIYIDPYQIKGGPPADVVLITHDHFDHLSIDDLKKIVTDKTTVIAAKHCENTLKKLGKGAVKYVSVGDEVSVAGIRVKAVHAYNVNKFREPGIVFHSREYGGVGYVLQVGDVSIYHAGDTDFIPEMKGLNVDIALLPVSGTYVMTAAEAAEAAKAIKPKIAIPMHYGAIVGSERDAQEFKRLYGGETVILSKED